MKKKQLKKNALLLLITSIMGVMINACNKNDLILDLDRLTQKDELSIEEAQKWYTTSQNPIFEIKPVKDIDEGVYKLAGIDPEKTMSLQSRPVLGKPNWERAKQSQKGKYAIVEMPIKTRGKMFFMDEDTRERFERTRDAKSITNAARLVIQKNLETGEMRTFIYVFIGTYEYLQKSKRMHKNTYFKREKDFEGTVLFYNLDGTLVNGWGYRDGKIVTRISTFYSSDVGSIKLGKQAGIDGSLNAGNRKLSSSGGGALNCTTAYIPVMSEGCEPVDVYGEWDDELGEEVTHIDYNCDPKWTMELVTVCDSEDGSGSDGETEDGNVVGTCCGGNNNGNSYGYIDYGDYIFIDFNALITIVTPVVEINLAQRLACFNSVPTNEDTNYRITLHAQRGGTSFGDKPGHGYITLEKTNGNQMQRLTYGFYPKANLGSNLFAPVQSAMGEEFGNDFRNSDARYYLNITKEKFDLAISTSLILAQEMYDLDQNNCVHYATDVFNAMDPPTGNINNNGFIIPDGLYTYLQALKNTHPSAEISVGRMRPPSSTNCN